MAKKMLNPIGFYLFIQLSECGSEVRLTNNLDEFRMFDYYLQSLSDNEWDKLKQGILTELDKYCMCSFTGNDTWFHIVRHVMWGMIDDDTGEALTDDVKLTMVLEPKKPFERFSGLKVDPIPPVDQLDLTNWVKGTSGRKFVRFPEDKGQ
jgi:hypothetical protein